jgi:hypothetical protein
VQRPDFKSRSHREKERQTERERTRITFLKSWEEGRIKLYDFTGFSLLSLGGVHRVLAAPWGSLDAPLRLEDVPLWGSPSPAPK